MGDIGIIGTHVDTEEGMEKFADKTVDELDELMKLEMAAWNKAELSLDQVSHDAFSLDVQVITVIKLLMDKGYFDIDDMRKAFRINFLEKAGTIRESIEQTRARSSIIVPGNGDVPQALKDIMEQQFRDSSGG